jgi:hypothetical protein
MVETNVVKLVKNGCESKNEQHLQNQICKYPTVYS